MGKKLLKKRYLFLIIIVCLFAISTVSAEEIDNETNVIANSHDSLICESVDDNFLSESYGTFEDLQEEINAVEENEFNISAPEVVKYFRGSERFVVTLTDNSGNPISNKAVIITINGAGYARTTNLDGTASIALGLNPGVYDVVVTCDDISVNSKVTVLSTIHGNDVVKIYGNDTHYYATFVDSEGNYLPKSIFVQFYFNRKY